MVGHSISLNTTHPSGRSPPRGYCVHWRALGSISSLPTKKPGARSICAPPQGAIAKNIADIAKCPRGWGQTPLLHLEDRSQTQ